MLVIDGNVILVAKMVPEPAEGWVSWFFLALLGSAGLGVLLRLHRGIDCKTFRGLARLDLCVFLPVVALSGYIHKTCINNLTLLDAAALRDPLLIEALEQGFMALMPGQLLSKQPDGLGIGDLVFQVAP